MRVADQLVSISYTESTTMKQPEWIYHAWVIDWVDGDTVKLKVDQGQRNYKEDNYRLNGINTPERGQLGYKEATQYAELLCPPGAYVVAETYKDPEKYGRYLVDLYIQDIDVDEAIIAAGLGVEYFGGPR